MATESQNSFGTLLRIDTGAGMTLIPGVKDFDPPPSMYEMIDITSHSSDELREEVAPGLKRNPEFTVPLVWAPANAVHQSIETAHDAQTLCDMETEFVGSARVWAYAAYISNLTVHAPVNGVYTADMTIKPTGAIDRNAA